MLKAIHDNAWIAAHIPHQGSMCLLDHVEAWNEESLSCIAYSHRSADNPLRARGQLAAACGIEYAAQAMAVHGALLAPNDTAPRAGYLVSVRGTRLYVPRLDDITADLEVGAICLTRNENNILYAFTIRAAEKLLLEGRAAVIVNAELLA
ncbi:MAG TPA: 3-hydroxylacyl-ACP dehydratase [Methylophilaceae bacterium]|nr:3-hydroxylacyl-ACP dehydratase [Methylophilaceae bacterium]